MGCLRSSAAGVACGCAWLGASKIRRRCGRYWNIPARQQLHRQSHQRSPPLDTHLQQLAAPKEVFEAIPELEFDQTANLAAEAGRDLWTHPAGADAEPVPELDFDQTLEL